MNKNKQLKQIIENLYNGFDSAALLSTNKDGILNVVREESSNYSFVVLDSECEFQDLISKLQTAGYSTDLDSFRGLIPARNLIKVDVAKKMVTRPIVVSINHYLQRSESITIADTLSNFHELVINENKKLADSLRQYHKNKN